MKKKSDNGSRSHEDDMDIHPMTRAEMRRGTMGKYAAVAERRTVLLDSDVAREFPDEGAVNSALRNFLRLREMLTHLTPQRRRKTA